mmetsp:Transcript_48274/g.75394  ORF Transcript_48274/g.75394 Transcript_48274/m.75394 type:complete len:294 (+) Transcript_48274:399-1280(+)
MMPLRRGNRFVRTWHIHRVQPSSSLPLEQATGRKLRQRKKLKVHANEGQENNVTEMFMACSYRIDGDYMFGVTVRPVAKALEALKDSTMLFNYHQRFHLWGANYIRENPSGCARSEPFKRRKKMSTAKVQRNAEEAEQTAKDLGPVGQNAAELRILYYKMKAEPRAVVRRSPIHNFGLFALRDIEPNDMVIEYVGEIVRHVIGDIRDDIALEKGKSTYMFRLDDDFIVDAMYKGNASRYINHCCDPNCYCHVVRISLRPNLGLCMCSALQFFRLPKCPAQEAPTLPPAPANHC